MQASNQLSGILSDFHRNPGSKRMKNLLKGAAAGMLVFSIVSCGGGSKSNPIATPPPPPPFPLSVCLPPDAKGNVACPAAQNVNIGASQQFNATFQGSSATVTWSINGVAGGNAATGTIT